MFPEDLNESMMSDISASVPLPEPAQTPAIRAATGILAHSFSLIAGNHL